MNNFQKKLSKDLFLFFDNIKIVLGGCRVTKHRPGPVDSAVLKQKASLSCILSSDAAVTCCLHCTVGECATFSSTCQQILVLVSTF